MDVRNKKKLKRLNLLEMSNHQRIQLIKEVREKLRQKVTEAKLWQSMEMLCTNLISRYTVLHSKKQFGNTDKLHFLHPFEHPRNVLWSI